MRGGSGQEQMLAIAYLLEDDVSALLLHLIDIGIDQARLQLLIPEAMTRRGMKKMIQCPN